MTTPVALYPLATSQIKIGGRAEIAAHRPVLGGLITNPRLAADQGIASAEALFVDVAGTASLGETATTIPVQPGATFSFPAGMTTDVTVNAATAGHRFSGFIIQDPTPYPPETQPGSFPPSGPTTLTALGGIAAYLYQEYDDDDDLQAFVGSFNDLAQSYVDWFANGALPVYTSDRISGALLDWVAAGLYGMQRPSLSSGRNRDLGPLNTYGPDQFVPLGTRIRIGPTDVVATTDDIFKRIMTWNFYKGDGHVFDTKWLKRRIMRFLIGINGTAPNIDETYAVSIIYGPKYITIRVTAGVRTVASGALPNRFAPGQFVTPGEILTDYVPPLVPVPFPLEPVLKEAIEAGVLQIPFQYQVAVII